MCLAKMNSAATRAVPGSEPRATAWAVSSVFHTSIILLMALAVSDVPRRGASLSGNSVGIVLELSAAAGDAFESDDGPGDSAPKIELVSQPELLAARLDEPTPPDLPIALTPTAAVAPVAATVSSETTRRPAASSQQAAPAASAAEPRRANAAGAQRRAGSVDGAGYARVKVFGVEGRGNKFVYVFDRSASMEGPPLAAAKRQLLESLGSLASIHQFHIIFFNQRLQVFDISGGGQRIAFGSDRNKQLAANFVGGIAAEGGTDRYAALRAAARLRPDVIFFLTDADDPMSASELAEIELECQRSGTTISVIEFGRDAAPANENFLKRLARQTGGQFGYVNTARLGW